MGEYMESLKKRIGYTSLKIKHAERQAKMFPSLLGLPGEKSSEQEVEKLWSMEEGEEVEMLTPIEERDRLIEKQKEEIEELLKTHKNSATLETSVAETKSENEILKKVVKTYEKKLLYTRNVTEQKLFETLSDPDSSLDDPHLVSLYTATLDEDEFKEALDIEDFSDDTSSRSRRDKFLANVEQKLDKSDPQHAAQLEKLGNLKNQVLEKVKLTHINKSRPRFVSSTPKRRLSLSLFDDRSKSRPRTGSPPPATASLPPPAPPLSNGSS